MPESFKAASEAVENSLNVLFAAERLAAKGLHAQALRSLIRGRDEVMEHAQTIYDLEDQLAAVSERISIRGSKGPVYFSNVHRAVLQLWAWVGLAIGRMNDGSQKELIVPADFLKRYKINVSLLSAQLHQERAKLLRDGRALAATGPEAKQPMGSGSTKPGRKSNLMRDDQIATEFYDGQEARLWGRQADYLRQKHAKRWKENPNAARAWLSTLLKRVRSKSR